MAVFAKTWRSLRLFAVAVLMTLSLLVAGVCAAWLWTQTQLNREESAVSPQEALRSFERALDWFRANEQVVLQDGNAALWWMVDAAARRSAHPYLANLVTRHVDLMNPPGMAQSPWRRLVQPKSPFEPLGAAADGLEGYQKFFLAAVTCDITNESRPYFIGHVCRPVWAKVWGGDRVCSTHQLMGLMLHERNGCTVVPAGARLSEELLDDIEGQVLVDPWMRDATIQRVLMLAWAGGLERPRPAWVRRVLGAQQLDGGWAGGSALPEWPSWMQPSAVKAPWSRSAADGAVLATRSDFHATAQGLLLSALFAFPESQPAKP